MTDRMNNQRLSNAKNVALWTLQIVTAAAFLAAGFGSLSGYPMMVETFEKIGIGQWFRYVTGLIEIVSAVLLLIPRFTPLGAALLICTMTGAVISHLTVLGGSPVPALVLLCFAGTILAGRFRMVEPALRKLLAAANTKLAGDAMSAERRAALSSSRTIFNSGSHA